MKWFEEMTDDEFNTYLCEPLRALDKFLRKQVGARGRELADDYRRQLVEYDRYMMESVET